MLKRILEALSALLEDTPVVNRLLEQMKAWGESQQASRAHMVSVLSNVISSFERAHAIVLIELSRLAAVRDADEYRRVAANEIARDKFYELFKTNEICEHVHQLHADLKSGFGDIHDSIILGAAKQLADALGEFEQGEYTLATQYQEYLAKVLMSPAEVNDETSLRNALAHIVDEQKRLASELASLTQFKQCLFQIALYG
jgi:GTP1/Obg family GTP-binding protein